MSQSFHSQILDCLQSGAKTKSQIAKELSANIVKVNNTIQVLKLRGYVRSIGLATSDGGRPTKIWTLTGKRSPVSVTRVTKPRKSTGSNDLGNFVPDAGGVLTEWTPPTEEVGKICEKHSKRKGYWGCGSL
jgi:predicted ArsR family transcriptional regulator